MLIRVLWCLAAVAGAALNPSSVQGQILYGSLVGNIRDATDAAVAGAAVTVTHRETNQTRQTASNEAGGYSLPNLQTGTYDVRVTKEGFNAYTESNVTVSINTVTRVDVSLRVGAVTESITVEASAAVLQTDRAEVRAEIGTKELTNLPVPLGRNYQQLFRTLMGFTPPGNAHSIPSNPSRALVFNVNGTSRTINNTRVDGASNANIFLPHIVAYVPSLESLETVNVVSNSFDAEQGLAGGAAINLQTKSGSNDLHGSMFWYHTDQHLKARPFFMPPGDRKPKLLFNEFGGTVGGPIKKDKIFYFFSYEGNYDRQNASKFDITVPIADIKRGDMSLSPTPIYDPLTGAANGTGRTEFLNKQIPASRISAITKKIADMTPLPNQPGLRNNFFATAPFIFDRHRADTKFNYNASSKLTMFGRFGMLHYDTYNQQVFGDVLGGPTITAGTGNPGYGDGNVYSLTTAGTYIFSPSLIMDAYFGYTVMDTSVKQPRIDEKIGLDFLGIPGTNGPRRFEGGWPRFIVSDYTNIGMSDANMPYARHEPQFQYVANFNWTKGSHEVKFGFDIYRQHSDQNQPEGVGAPHGAQGGFTFQGGPTQLSGGPASNQFNSYSAFLLGLPRVTGKILLVPDIYTNRAWLHSLYVRDRWNATRKLTLSYGLRWEYFPHPTRADRGLERYDVDANKILICGVGVVPTNCGVEVSKRMFAPRLGLAYRATDTFVIRAGYGITNDPFSLSRPFRNNYPILVGLDVQGANAFTPAGRIEDGIPPIPVPDLGNGIIDLPLNVGVNTVDTRFRRGYIQSWNLTMQKQMRYGLTGQVGYVATRQVRQMGTLNINAGYVIGAGQAGRPLFERHRRTGDTRLVTPLGSSHYDSLQASLERRFSRGLQLAVHYTWSKVIGVVDDSDGSLLVPVPQFYELNRTVRNYDRPHNLQVTNIWELPFGRGRTWLTSGPASALFGGWQVNNILSFLSGRPFSVTADGAALNLPGSTQRADQVKPQVQKLGNIGASGAFFDPLAFRSVTQPRFGTAGFNSLRGPGIVNWDLGVFRRFSINERWNAEFRMEAFNFTNTPHFNQPGSNVSVMSLNADGTVRALNGFSQVTSTTSIAREGIDERQFRFGLRISF
jgi:hypothetical protein